MPEQEPGDRSMFYLNAVGISVVAGLLMAFLLLNGPRLLAFIQFLTRPTPWPDH